MKETDNTNNLSRKEKKELKILALFTSVYCRDHHLTARSALTDIPDSLAQLRHYMCCESCQIFLRYAIQRRIKCPLEDKPSCRKCHIHCYRPADRLQVQQVMRYSGKALIKKGRLDLVWHYLF